MPIILRYHLPSLRCRPFSVVRLLHLFLLLTALLGLAGQTTAMATVRGHVPLASIVAMDCTDMAKLPGTEKAPCKKMTIQCIAAMGCSPVSLVVAASLSIDPPLFHHEVSPLQLATRLATRSISPEPEPPAILN